VAQFILVITEATTDQYLKLVETVDRSNGTVKLRPEAVPQGTNNGHGVVTSSMSSSLPGGKIGFANIRVEWAESGAKHGAEIVKIFEPKPVAVSAAQ
jgi:hypothetical protein